jgi:hypothetical protein
VITAQRRRGFHLLLPIGIEKLIPVPIATATKKVAFGKVDRAMGISCGLIQVPGRKLDEVDALAVLGGVEATPIAAGGLGGAEGSVVLAIAGTEEQVARTFEICLSVKGTTLPTPHILDCNDCRHLRSGQRLAAKNTGIIPMKGMIPAIIRYMACPSGSLFLLHRNIFLYRQCLTRPPSERIKALSLRSRL